MVLRFGRKIPVNIYPSFCVMMLLVGSIIANFNIGLAIVAAIVIFFSIMAHELGHALAARFLGLRPEINLIMLGGNTKSRSRRELSAGSHFFMVLCGPLMGMVLAAVAFVAIFLLKDELSLARFAGVKFMLNITFFINLTWTLVNLLPIMPMDGGNLLKIFLERFWGVRGLKATYIIGMLLSGIAGFFFFSYAPFLGVFFLLFAFENYRSYSRYRLYTKGDDDPEGLAKLLEIESIADSSIAMVKLEGVIARYPSGVIHLQAVYKKSLILYKENRYREAYDNLMTIYKYLQNEERKLLLNLADLLDESRIFISIGESLFSQNGGELLAYNIAHHYALEKNIEATIGWVKIALERGFEKCNICDSQAISALSSSSRVLSQLLEP